MKNHLFSASLVMLGFTTMVVASPSFQLPGTAVDRAPSTTGSTRSGTSVTKVSSTDASLPTSTNVAPSAPRPAVANVRPDSVASSTRARFAKAAEPSDAGIVPAEDAPFRERVAEPLRERAPGKPASAPKEAAPVEIADEAPARPLKTVPYKSMSASKAASVSGSRFEAPAGEPETAEPPPPASKNAKASQRPAVDEIDEPPAPSRRKVSDYRSAKYAGGQGATWKTGRNSHGFSGSYGGCRYIGFAGPGGFKLDRSC